VTVRDQAPKTGRFPAETGEVRPPRAAMRRAFRGDPWRVPRGLSARSAQRENLSHEARRAPLSTLSLVFIAGF
jgi:hypothetical protein